MKNWSNWSGRWSRRSVLTLVAAGVGEVGALAASAAAGAHFATAAIAAPAAPPSKSTSQSPITVSGPLAAFVPDAQGSTIIVMRGDKEMTITNPTLVQALLSLSSSF